MAQKTESSLDLDLHTDNNSCMLQLNDQFLNIVDNLDQRIAEFRQRAIAFKDEHETLSDSIDMVKNNEEIYNLKDHERYEIFNYLQHVKNRLSTVEVNILTKRNKEQEEALKEANNLLNKLKTHRNPAEALKICKMYLNACSYTDDDKIDKPNRLCDDEERSLCIIDKKFENVVLGCALDDQKYIKKSLTSLLSSLAVKLKSAKE